MSDFDKAIEAFRTLGLRRRLLRARAVASSRRPAHRAGDRRYTGSADKIFAHPMQRGGEDRQGESVSGPGSTMQFTEFLRRDLEELLRQRQVSNLLDAPCGDWNWFSQSSCRRICDIPAPISFPIWSSSFRKSTGATISSSVFWTLPRTSSPKPICGCAGIVRAPVQCERETGSGTVLCVDHTLCAHLELHNPGPQHGYRFGDFRPLDLTKPPFSLPPPELAIDDWPGEQGIRQVGSGSVTRLPKPWPLLWHPLWRPRDRAATILDDAILRLIA